jgi:hypothetical protein
MKPITVGELLKDIQKGLKLKQITKDCAVMLASDAEGNSFRGLRHYSLVYFDCNEPIDDVKDVKKGALPSLLFWPVD